MGVGLPEAHRQALAEYLARCQAVAPGLRWVRAESLHLTLRFLGSLGAPVLERMKVALQAVRFAPFEVSFGGPGTFGRGVAVRVVYLDLATGRDRLAALAAEVDAASLALGLEPEERTYNPHLTLGRARERRGAGLPALPPPPELSPWRVDSFNLYRSRLGRGGATYSVLEQFPAS